MRIRSIKPEFFKDEELAELDPLTRLFFIGLWCAADANGVVEDRPKRLAIEILPYETTGKQLGNNGETSSVVSMLNRLAEGNWIAFFDKDGKDYISIRNWTKHQRITGKESANGGKFPVPPSDLWGKQLGNTREAPSATPDAQEQGAGNREQGARNREQGKDLITDFELVWKENLVNNRKGDSKKIGRERFNSCIKNGYSLEKIKEALRHWAKMNSSRDDDKRKGFSTWLWPDNIDDALAGNVGTLSSAENEANKEKQTLEAKRIQEERIKANLEWFEANRANFPSHWSHTSIYVMAGSKGLNFALEDFREQIEKAKPKQIEEVQPW